MLSARCRFSIDVISKLVHIQFDKINKFEKKLSLIFDKMKILSGLVFSRTTGKLDSVRGQRQMMKL